MSRTVELVSQKGPHLSCTINVNTALKLITQPGLLGSTRICIEFHLVASHYQDYFVYPGSVVHLLSDGLARSFEPRNSCC